mmetsp:Transcript_1582/g.4813  ORF Transcript_1582/g.4813 Transcript_1582/m.4813 type:complete len:514 (-) Transcript_1582:165-1706(-)
MMQSARRKTHQSHAWRSLFKKQFHKTKLCRYYNVGQCRYGTECPFAHSQSELSVAPDLTKTTMCEAWLAGHCSRPLGQCQFAHGEEELRVTPAFGNSTLCKRRTGKDSQDSEFGEPEQVTPISLAPYGAGLVAAQHDSNWPPEAMGITATSPGADEVGGLPLTFGLLSPSGGALPWPHAADGLMPDFPLGASQESFFQANNSDKSTAVVHLADHLLAEDTDPPPRPASSRAARASAMLPRTSGWLPPSSASPWPPSAIVGVPPQVPAPGPSVPVPTQIPVPQMFGLPDTADPSLADHAKAMELATRIAALADAQTATPGSLTSSLSCSSPLRWARTPSSAASPERTQGLWDRTPSPPSPRRKSSPAYVDPIGTVTFRELPEEDRVQEPPLSPEVRWARTPSTSPPRRVGGGLRFTNRGPPDLHRLGDIFQAASGDQGASGSDSAAWGAAWPSPPGVPHPGFAGGDGGSEGPHTVPIPLGATLGSPWGGAAQAFERILENLPQGREPSGETAAR